MSNRDALRVSYTGRARAWKGVLRDQRGEIVWICSHAHQSRDYTSRMAVAAIDCALDELMRRFPYTQDELDEPRAAVEAALRRVDTDRTNNPMRGRADLAIARLHLSIVEDDFRRRGLLPAKGLR